MEQAEENNLGAPVPRCFQKRTWAKIIVAVHGGNSRPQHIAIAFDANHMDQYAAFASIPDLIQLAVGVLAISHNFLHPVNGYKLS